MEIPGKIAIVTGASGGIGEATARLLAKKGAKVALVARSKDKLQILSDELPESFPVVADLSKESRVGEVVQEVTAHFGGVDILINNAGQGYDATIEEIDTKIFYDIFALDVVAPLIAMQEVIPQMKKQKSGAIVNISSGTALMYLPGMGGYASLKRALAHLSLTAREELKDFGIIVSVVYPFITSSDFEQHTIKSPSMKEDLGETNPNPPPADPPEYAAQKILDAITSGQAEVFAHEWMGK